ncbi:putative pectinesterase A [Glarea lozoyensis 74030]|uniref:Pectinesterase n=1 Tax=Glarea lozoyensis (strain ATCC 74030 / MF5533) TaxID=1104152 RepID=H0EXP8_GLAL7|nr:putative pectinesterase A [Glarea lozoyensis 74030]
MEVLPMTANAENLGFYGCKFLGNQDTLYAKSGAQYYKNCYIEGTTDFIFGNAAAWFEASTIAAKKASAITAMSRTQATETTWYVFEKCSIVAAKGFSLKQSVFLGRPWRVLARVIYQNSVLSDIIAPKGWTTMAENATPIFQEFNNSGAGSDISKRLYTTKATAAMTQSKLWKDSSWIDSTY